MSVFENKVLKRKFESKRENSGRLGKISNRNEELHNFYSSLNIITVITSRKMRWVGLVPHMEETRNTYKNFVVKVKGIDHLEDLGVDGMIALKCM
jgi:hypothetical protein